MLEHILKDDPVYRQLKDEVEDYCGPVLVSGCTDTAKWHLTSLIGNHKKKQFKIIIVPDENKARQWVEASHFFGEKVQYIRAKDYSIQLMFMEMQSQETVCWRSRRSWMTNVEPL